MRFSEFERVARAVWEEIPAQYREGVDGLIIDQEAHTTGERPDVYTLGECVTENYPSQYGGPETIRSAVVLYYGSFKEVASDDAEFDWAGEIHETVMHELRHHLEALADEDALGDFDFAVEENFKRYDGDEFDLFFFRSGELVEPNVYRVDEDVFVEALTEDRGPVDFGFEWEGASYQVQLPATETDVTYVELENVPFEPGGFYIVRVVRRGVLATLRAVFQSGFSYSEAIAEAQRK